MDLGNIELSSFTMMMQKNKVSRYLFGICHENLEPVRFPSPFCQGDHFRRSHGNPLLPANQ